VALLVVAGPAAAFSRQEVTLTSADGTRLAASLFLPDAPAPAGGWPAVIYMHGLGGDRTGMNELARQMGVIGEQYAVLTYDARGHGQSGGLIAIDGPNELADTKAAFAWLAARADVADAKIGAWGISYGGGAAWNSLAADVPWAAVEACETWTNLKTALLPQGLAKSGVVAGFLGSLDPAKVDPLVLAVRDGAYSGNLAGIDEFSALRSSLAALKGRKTPVFLMQGRRDFAFGIEQAISAYQRLAGPKRLWIGNHGHAPSSFPAADTPKMLAEGKLWFDRYLRGARVGLDDAKPVVVAAANSSRVERFAAVPRTITVNEALGGRRTFTAAGKWQGTTARTTGPLEVFGSPVVRVEANAAAGWSRLVAVLSATTPSGQELVVSGGGVPTRPGLRTYAITMINQATFVPRGSRLTLTIGSSSLAQNPGNLLYLDLPMQPGAKLTVGAARLALPVLALPVSR
jgi:predicted acyl esterase